MWHRDALYYNTKKFNADCDLLDVDLSINEVNEENAQEFGEDEFKVEEFKF